MIGYSFRLKTDPAYAGTAKVLFAAMDQHGEPYCFFGGAKDIWARDYMPTKTRSGRYVSFRYAPSYLIGFEEIRTSFRDDIAPLFRSPVIYSDIVLDGGNIVFSPSKEKAILSDRVFSENPGRKRSDLLQTLQCLLEAEIIIIPAHAGDMTGHADGMVRFIDENTVLGNRAPYKTVHEQKIKRVLKRYGISVVDFPYSPAKGDSAVGCYLNYLETEHHIFLPVFGIAADADAITAANAIWEKEIVPVSCADVAKEGGVLNCISCEMG